MGNVESSPRNSGSGDVSVEDSALVSFPGAKFVETALQCGDLDDEGSLAGSNHGKKKTLMAQLLKHAEHCVMSPQNSEIAGHDGDNGLRNKSDDDADHFFDEEYEELGRGRIKSSDKKESQKKQKQQQQQQQQQQQIEGAPKQETHSSALLARSLMSEVGSPNAMSPNTMTQREKKLLKAQEKARQHNLKYGVSGLKLDTGNPRGIARPIGSPSEGVGQPSVMGTLAHAITGTFNDPVSIVSGGEKGGSDPSVLPPNSLSEHRAAQVDQRTASGKGLSPAISDRVAGKHAVTIGLSLSRRSSSGHRDTVTRQTAFDFNELQDREYKYVSSTDSSGWVAGGGERGGNSGETEGLSTIGNGLGPGTPSENSNKMAAPDTVHIPIIQIDAESSQAVDAIISALARGEIFIPHMAIIPETLSVNGVSPPDLVVRFGTERNEDLPPDEWPNWCLEFMHNQLYEYFHRMGARWMKRPFSITLAKKVRWKTVKHMNRYFSHAERVIDAWREKGPQYLDPQLAYIDGGATPEEVARPHGIYLLRNGVPTNYFAPNFNPPYTTKMTRSLLYNVLGKSWDKKRREWTSTPIPKLITPAMLVSAMCGCTDDHASGFVATEATYVDGPLDRSTTVPANFNIRSLTPKTPKVKPFDPSSPLSSQMKKTKDRSKKAEQFKFDNNKPVNSNGAHASMPKNQNRQMVVSPEPPSNTNDSTTSAQLSPKIELNISSSSASFFDGAQGDSIEIPPPPLKSFAEKQEGKKGEGMDSEPRKLEPLKNSRQPLQPQEQRQDKQQEHRPEDDNNQANNENSGDSKNHALGKKHEDKLIKTKQEKTITSDEEWLNEVEASTKPEYKTIASLQAEQGHQIQVRSVVQSETLIRPFDPLSDKFRDGTIGPGSPTVRSNNSSKSSRNAMMNKSNEMGTLSMEYSVDDKSVGASTFIGCDKSVGTFDSTLLGQNFAADSKSLVSVATKEPLVVKEILQEVPEKEKTTHSHQSSFTAGSSYCTFDEHVPSDEELFAAGWAKALDSNCGSYYYFTLDRKTTCWDNPLAPPVSPSNSDEESSVGEL